MPSLITPTSVVCSVVCIFLLMGNVCGTVEELNYTCNIVGEITVVNPNATTLIWVQAYTTDGPCNASFTPSNEEVNILNCSLSSTITLILSPDAAGIPEIITGAIKYYTIRCQEVPDEGITKEVVDKSWVTNLLETSRAPAVTPQIDISSFLLDNATVIGKNEIMVGEPIIWEITGPDGYKIIPLNCTAYSGSPDDEATLSMHIIENGCSLDKNLMSDFNATSSTNILQATLYAFRFADSPNVTINCVVRGCPEISSACDIACSGDRKRRFTDFDNDVVSIKTILKKRSIESQTNVRQRNDPFEKIIGITFTVIDRIVSGSPKTAAVGCIVLVILFTHLLIGSCDM